MRYGHLKGVFASDRLALPASYLLVLPLSNIFQLGVHIHDLLLFLLFCKCAARLTTFDLWKGVYLPLHSVDLEGTAHILLQLRLENLAEEV